MHDKKPEPGATELAWELFQKTGNISYYMLYHELKQKGGKK